jgi:hypothetical protein
MAAIPDIAPAARRRVGLPFHEDHVVAGGALWVAQAPRLRQALIHLARFVVPVRLHGEVGKAGRPANAGDGERYPAGTQPPSTWITWPLM